MAAYFSYIFLLLFVCFCCSNFSRSHGDSIWNCCKYIQNDIKSLIECTNSKLINWNIRHDSTSIPYKLGQLGPSLSLSILSRSTENIFAYSAYSHFIQSIYTIHNNYRMQPILSKDSDVEDYRYYRKLVPILELMNSSALHSDYIVWMDAGHV